MSSYQGQLSLQMRGYPRYYSGQAPVLSLCRYLPQQIQYLAYQPIQTYKLHPQAPYSQYTNQAQYSY